MQDGTTINDGDTRTAADDDAAAQSDEDQEPRLVTRLRRPVASTGVVLLDVIGEIDLATVPAFKQAILAALDQSENKRLILIMTGVSYMDSSGFGTLLSANKGLRASGGALSLVGCNQVITRMIFITRLNTLFDLYDSEDKALAAAVATMPAPAAVSLHAL